MGPRLAVDPAGSCPHAYCNQHTVTIEGTLPHLWDKLLALFCCLFFFLVRLISYTVQVGESGLCKAHLPWQDNVWTLVLMLGPPWVLQSPSSEQLWSPYRLFQLYSVIQLATSRGWRPLSHTALIVTLRFPGGLWTLLLVSALSC